MALTMKGFEFTTTNLDGVKITSKLVFDDMRTDGEGRRAYTLYWEQNGKKRAQCFFAVPPERPKATRLTLKKVTAALPKGYELVKGEGYFYFAGNDAMSWYSSSVLVFRINDLTLEQWVTEFETLRAAKDHRGAGGR